MKVKAIAKEAMQEINVIAYNEEPKAPDLYFTVRRFNMLVDTLKADKLTVNHVTRAEYDLVANQASYTIGPGGNWNGVRPQEILRAGFVNTYVSASTPLETYVRVMTDEEWAAVNLKSLTSTVVWGLWYETQYAAGGLGKVWVRPIITNIGKIALYVPVPLDEVAETADGLLTDVLVPPGYRKMLVTNLALDICDGFEKTPSASLVSKASLSMSIVKRSNIKRGIARLPAELLRRTRRGYKILTNS